MIEIQDIWKIYGGATGKLFADGLPDPEFAAAYADHLWDQGCTVAVQGVALTVPRGQTLAVIGPSGAGKSVLIRAVSRLIEPSAGDCRIDEISMGDLNGDQLRSIRRDEFGMISANKGLLPHLDVRENIAFPLMIQKIARPDRDKRVAALLDWLEVGGLATRKPHTLSERQKTKITLARSLINEPSCWLLDDPFAAIDLEERAGFQELFRSMRAESGTTALFMTDNIDEALAVGDQVAVMRDGAIVQTGTPDEIIADPVNGFVRRMISHVPKSRILLIDSLIEPIATLPVTSGPILHIGMSIEEAVMRSASGVDRLRVADGSGRIIGTVRSKRLLGSALTRQNGLRKSA